MRYAEVRCPGIYAMRVSGVIVPVKITGPYEWYTGTRWLKGFTGFNMTTGRALRMRTAARLRYPLDMESREHGRTQQEHWTAEQIAKAEIRRLAREARQAEREERLAVRYGPGAREDESLSFDPNNLQEAS